MNGQNNNHHNNEVVYPESFDNQSSSTLTKRAKSKPPKLLWIGLIGAAITLVVAIIVGLACYYSGYANGQNDRLTESENNAFKAGSTGASSEASGTGEPLTVSSSTSMAMPKSTTTPASSEPTAEQLRIPKTLEPVSYDLTYKMYFPSDRIRYSSGKNFTFDGDIKLRFRCTSRTSTIVLNAKNLNISQQTFSLQPINQSGKKQIQLVTYQNEQKKYEMIRFHLKEELEEGKEYQVSFTYRGIINEGLDGIYRSSYREKGRTKWLVASQMQPVSARKAFPGFDEPEYKASFTASIVHPADMTAISNGERLNTVDKGDGWLQTFFEESPKMSSYLVAYSVCDFKNITRKTKRGVPFRIWARPEFIEHASLAADVGPKVLDFYETIFGIEFPLKKQDMIAYPDFEAGAMENWGLITFRESLLLYDQQNYDLHNKIYVIIVIAHELGHMWFGNLVTMKWWDDLWLNEGFATNLEYWGTEYYTDGNSTQWNYFVKQALGDAMRRDSEASSHPLYVPITRVIDIDDVFDSISYNKGGSVLEMLKYTIGVDAYKKGLNVSNLHALKFICLKLLQFSEFRTVSLLQKYLEEHKYGNTRHTDFFDSMTQTVMEQKEPLDWNGNVLNINKYMEPWTIQMGFPVVTATRNYDRNTVQLSQKRFKMNPEAKEKERYLNPKYGYEWFIPIWYQTPSKRKSGLEEYPQTWIQPKQSVTISNVTSKDWFLLNSLGQDEQVKGYYFVNYDQRNWQLIQKQLETDHTKIGSMMRYYLIENSFELARAGLLDYQVPLSLTKYLGNETDYLPTFAVRSNMAVISNYFRGSPGYHYVQKYMANLLEGLYERVKDKWDTSPQNNDLFSESMVAGTVETACNFDVKACVDKAKEKFVELKLNCGKPTDRLSSKCNVVKPHVRRTVYSVGIETGDLEDWNWLWSKFKMENVAVEQSKIISGLVSSSKPWVLVRLLDETITGKNIRLSQSTRFWAGISRNPIGGQIIWQYYNDHFEKVYERYSSSSFLRGDVTKSVIVWMKSEYGIQLVKEFIAAHPKETASSAFEQSLEAIQTNKKWMDENYSPLLNWFKTELRKIDNAK